MLSSISMFMWSSFRNKAQLSSRRQRLFLLVLFAVVVGIAWFSLQALSKMPDFRQYVAGPERKAAFIEFVRPLIEAGNEQVRQDRERLLAIAADADPGFFDRRWLASIAKEYAIEEPDPDDPSLVDSALLHVDTVPLSLAIAQSAKESGWGTSRFARDGYNLFGEWCFDEGCGMVPKARSAGRHHEVESFRSPRHSVASYLNNINTHPKYQAFRLERARLRARNNELSGVALAEKLSQYSERREAYVEEIRQLIRTNDLESLRSNDSH
jgi:Bax protein